MSVEKFKQFEAYLKALRERGERLPIRISGRKLNFRAISAASGVGYKYLCTRPFRQRITLAVKEIGLFAPEASRTQRELQAFEKNLDSLGAYLKRLEAYGHKLPEHPKHRGQIFFRQVEVEAGLSHDALTSKNVRSEEAPVAILKKTLTNAAKRVGVEVRILPRAPRRDVGRLTYERLREGGSKARAVELKNKPLARQQLYNTRTAYILMIMLDKC